MAVDLVIDIDNTPGALAQVAAAISDAGVNIAAATCLAPGDRAELHILVKHAEAVRHALAISHLAVSREREFHADLVAVSAAGSNAVVHCLLRTEFGHQCFMQALNDLATIDSRKAHVIELRFFGGLSVEETAEVLKISPQSVMRDWKLARTWLRRELRR